MSMFPVAEIDAATAAFPASVRHLMPPYADIPKEFRDHDGGNVWQRLVSDWFFGGVKNLKLTPKDGIDTAKALQHVTAILRSFEPKHEHKEAACAYLLSQWFSNATWEKGR
jgi:hypothetical protein